MSEIKSVEVLPRRGLSLELAAKYVGVSPTYFRSLVEQGQMPRPRRIGARKLFDIRDLDLAFDELPMDGQDERPSDWDDL